MGEAAKGDRVGGNREGGEVLLRKLDEFTVVDTAGSDKDHAVSGVVGLDVGVKVAAVD